MGLRVQGYKYLSVKLISSYILGLKAVLKVANIAGEYSNFVV
jgi:hypothetical protein